jgi:hypothetical protein
MAGVHALGTTVARGGTGADVIKAALHLASATINAATTVLGAGEVAGTNYAAGGVVVTNANPPAVSGTAAIWTPSANIVYPNVTLATPFDAVLIYNSSQGNKAISVHTFGAQTVTAGTFTLTIPANAVGTALLQIS